MARVQGEGRRNGRTPQDIPDGYIEWDEHHEAWAQYQRRVTGRSSEQVEADGGFTYYELKSLLGRPPHTWVLRDPERFRGFVRAEEDLPGYEEKVQAAAEAAAPPVLSHIYYVGGEQSICAEEIRIPEGPIFFDGIEAPGCKNCFSRMVDWLDWFTGEQKVD
jgi:hypothetical protein